MPKRLSILELGTCPEVANPLMRFRSSRREASVAQVDGRLADAQEHVGQAAAAAIECACVLCDLTEWSAEPEDNSN